MVGAGSAGCVAARRLLDGTDATVLLLEAGGAGDGVASLLNPPQWVENLGSPYDWAYRYEPSPHVAHRAQARGSESRTRSRTSLRREAAFHSWRTGEPAASRTQGNTSPGAGSPARIGDTPLPSLRGAGQAF